ncbi:mechanosensitive ion channel family protein [Oceanicaulis alexandrii]|uniref:mechanosensitive ion channel family protein n=1 Tax=Oceanicaulis alexandrii TaxID=153233 RepID=UPI0035D0EEB4
MSVQAVTEQLPEPVRDSMAEFFALAAQVWEQSFLGFSVGQGLSAIGVLAISIVFRGLFSSVIVARVRKAATKTETQLDDKLLEALYGPIKLIPVIIGLFIAMTILGLNAEGAPINGDRVVQTVMVIALFWGLHNAVTPVALLFAPLRRALNPVMIDWMAKALRILFLIIGVATVLSLWEIPVAGVIGGLGLLGVAVGLGAQDLFKNLIAGILILTEKRFVPGEWVKVDGVVEGTVEQINFRSTLIRRFDKGPVYVPNAFLSDQAVTNFSRMTHRRIKWVIGVEYKTTTDQLAYIRDNVLDWVLNHPEFAKPPEVSTFMHVDKFGPSSIDFFLYCFTTTTNWGEWLRIKEELAFAIKRIVEEAGTGFAFPSTTIYMDDGAELFVPPKVKKHEPQDDPDKQSRFIARGEGSGGAGEGEGR